MLKLRALIATSVYADHISAWQASYDSVIHSFHTLCIEHLRCAIASPPPPRKLCKLIYDGSGVRYLFLVKLYKEHS